MPTTFRFFVLAGVLLTVGGLSPNGRLHAESPGKPAVARLSAPVTGPSPADYAQHIQALKDRMPGGGFTIILQPPFVVIGDEAPEQVRRRAELTVKWAVDLLKKQFFAKDPQEILDIWLFRDKESYEANARRLFHQPPHTPFGYFSHADGALVMNISTGGGTLVHEIVHPFMAANFPKCPAWFNEGLASLYEQSGEESGRIHGYPNWRLPGLQKTIRGKRLPAFQELCSTTTDEFYEDEHGTNYAQARYLCYYLQEKGLLEKFYRQFRDNARQDPDGYETLRAVLGNDGQDMAAFQREWEAFVLKLKFPDG